MISRAPIFTDTFVLCQWLLARLDEQPGVLARRICDNALRLLEAVTLALKKRGLEQALLETDNRLLILRLQLRLAGAIALLNDTQTLYALRCADTIGNQLGGWRKSLRKPAAKRL
jgi:hypothetical protein